MWSRPRMHAVMRVADAHAATSRLAPPAPAPDTSGADIDGGGESHNNVAPNPVDPPAVDRPGILACVSACQADATALETLREVVATLPAASSAAAASCPAACTFLGQHGLAAHAGLANMPLCSQSHGGGAAPGYLLNSSALGQAALDVASAGLGPDASRSLATALSGARQGGSGGMTPSQALAVDSLVGTLRRRDPSDGWQRVSSASPCLAFPRDHGLHANIADEWYFVVGVLSARGAGETADTLISFCWMLDYRLVAPSTGADGLTSRLVDVQFALGEEGAPNSALQAAVWGAATPLVASADPALHLQCGGMELRERATPSAAAAAAAPPDGLGEFELRGANPSAGTLLDVTLVRSAAAAPLVLENASGIIGDPANGNGFYYYSAPFLAVQPGGRVVSVNAQGATTARTVTGGLAWFDHQFGTIGLPTSGLQTALLQTIAAASPRSIPVIDRGFSIVGQENWFGLMFSSGPLQGLAFMGTVIALDPVAKLQGGYLAGNWILPDGTGGAQVANVSGGSASATAVITSADGASTWGAGYNLVIPLPPVLAQAIPAISSRGGNGYTMVDNQLCVTVSTRNLARDGFMQWSKGDTYSEAAQVLQASDGSGGYGWSEQVGWDTQSTAKILNTVNLLSPADQWEQAPAAFRTTGYIVLLTILILGVVVLVGLGMGGAALVRHVRHASAPRLPPQVLVGGLGGGIGGGIGGSISGGGSKRPPATRLTADTAERLVAKWLH